MLIQTFKGVSAKGNEASQLQFVVKNNISLKDIQKAYGKDLKKENGKTRKLIAVFFTIKMLKRH